MSGIDQFRQAYPEDFEGLNDYQAVQKIAERTGRKPDEVASMVGYQMPTMSGEFGKGLARGWQGMKGAGSGLVALAGDSLGLDSVREWGEEGVENAKREAQRVAPAVGEFTDIGGLQDAGLYTMGVVGEQGPQVALSLPVAGGAGAFAARGALKAATEKGLAKAAAQKAAQSAATRGQYLGGATIGTLQETGSISNDIHERTREYQPLNALVHGTGAGLLEGLSDVAAIKGITGGRTPGMGRLRHAGQELVKQGAISGLAEELPQDAIEQHALMTADPTYQFDTTRSLNAAAAGAIGGGVIGGGMSLAAPSQATLDTVRSIKEKGLLETATDKGVEFLKKHGKKEGRERAANDLASNLAIAEAAADKIYGPKEDDQDVLESIARRKQPDIGSPLTEAEASMSDDEVAVGRKQMADDWAQRVLSSQGGEYSASEREAAAAYQTGQVDWKKVNEMASQARRKKQSMDDVNELLRAAGADDAALRELEMGGAPETKSSMMGATPVPTGKMGVAERTVTMLQKLHANEKVKMDAKRVATVADALTNSKYGWADSIVEAATDVATKDKQLTTAAALLHWMGNGLRTDNAYGADFLDTFMKQYGDRGIKMMDKAYEVGVAEALFTANDDRFSQVKEMLAEKSINDKQLQDLVFSRMSPSIKAQYSIEQADVPEILNHLRRTVTLGKGDKLFEQLFPNPEYRNEVAQVLYDEQMSRQRGFGTESRATKPVDDDGTSRTVVTLEAEEKQGAPSEDDGLPETLKVSQKVGYRSSAGNRGFNRATPEGRELMRKATSELQKGSEDSGVRVEQIGAIDMAMERAKKRLSKDQLSEDEAFAAMETEVKRYTRKSLDRPVAPPEGASELAVKLYNEDFGRYKQRIKRAAQGVNRRYKYLKSTQIKDGELSTEIDLEAIKGSRLNRREDDPKNRPEDGTMWFETAEGGKFLITAPQLMRLVFQRSGKDGDPGLNHEVGTGEDKQALAKGGPQNVLEMFQGGIGSVLQHDFFSGKFGYMTPQGPVEVTGSAQFPDNFKISSGVTYGQAKASAKARAAKIEGNDFDQEEIGLPTRRLQATWWQKISALKSAVKEITDKREAEKLSAFIGHVLSEAKRIKEQGGRGDDLVSRKNHVLISKWMSALDLKAGTIDVADSPNEKGRAQDGLKAYDPETDIIRGEDGRPITDNDEMVAASHTGRSMAGTKPVAERKVGDKIVDERITENVEGQPGVATKESGLTVKDGLTETQLEAAKQTFVELMRKNVEDVIVSVGQMRGKELALFETAAKYFSALSSTNVESLANGYFSGDKNAARMFTTSLSRSNVAIQSAIATRKGEVNGRVATGGEEAFGEGRQAHPRGSEARVASRNNGERAAPQSELRPGDTERSADRAVDRGGRPEQVAKLIRRLGKIKPKNVVHARAIRNLIGVLDGSRQGDITKAMQDMMRWDQTLGGLTERQRDYLEQLSAPVADQGPVDAYDGEFDVDEDDLAADRALFSAETRDSKQDAQDANSDSLATEEQMEAVRAKVHDIVGKDISVQFADTFLDKSSGSWTKQDVQNLISLARNASDVMGTGIHEAMHQLVHLLKKHGGHNVVQQLQRVAMSKIMQQRLRVALKDNLAAIEQLKDPEEALAYMFQFWSMDPDGFLIGPETKSLFQKIQQWAKKALSLFSKKIREAVQQEQLTEVEGRFAERMFATFHAGKLANPETRTAVVEALSKDAEKQANALKNINDRYIDFVRAVGKLGMTTEGVLEAFNNPYLTRVARQFNQRAGEAMGDIASYFDEKEQRINRTQAKLNKLWAEASKEDVELAREHLVKYPGKPHPSPEVDKIVKGVRAVLDEMKAYIQERDIKRLDTDENGNSEWVSIDFLQDYFPQKWDSEAVTDNKEQFLADLMTHHKDVFEGIAAQATAAARRENPKAEATSVEDVAEHILMRVMNPNAQRDLEETESGLGMTPAATSINRRNLKFLDMKVFDKYLSKDLVDITGTYVRNIVQRGEYQHRFGYGGEKLRENMDAGFLYELDASLPVLARKAYDAAVKRWKKAKAEAMRQGERFDEPFPSLKEEGLRIYRKENPDTAQKAVETLTHRFEAALNSVMALEGTLGHDMSPDLRRAQSWVTTYQNFRLLVPGLFGSFMDVMGVVREGGELSDAWGTFVAGIKEAKNVFMDKHDDSYLMQRAELFGTADAASFGSAISQQSGSIYMDGKARRWSEKLFKYNGMEGWNRGVRAYATMVAERTLLSWKHGQIDMTEPAAVARVERLFGKGFDPKNIVLDANGNVDITDPKNVAAVNRWVLDAVMKPNAAVRTTWMSDPHFQIFSHLKSFTYTQHAVMMKNAVAQARLGNYRPMMVSMLGYAPIAIAAGAIKEMLIPGEEPAWMKGGLGGYLSYGWERAGVLGVPQMIVTDLFKDPASVAGPSIDQLQNMLTVPLGELQADLWVVGDVGWRDHRIFEESFGALPFGTAMRRAGVAVDDWIAE